MANGNIIFHDARVTGIFQWLAGIMGTVITASILWIGSSVVDLKRDMAVLLDRPEAVSKVQYERDIEQFDRRIGSLEGTRQRDSRSDRK